MKNPFSLTFGKEPLSMISRSMQETEILDAFTDENPPYQVCMITGVRGAGKTVSLTAISNALRKNSNFLVIDLNPERDMLQALAAELSNRAELLELFRDAKINLSFLGFGLEIDGVPPITDVAVAIDRMLGRLSKTGKRILITVDEAAPNSFVREFASQFQIYMRRDYPVFLLMTGLYENIYELQNEKTLTFLYRAPKLELKPLNMTLIAEKYRMVFHLSQEDALAMAKATGGYPFAYQALGYLCFRNECEWKEILPEYDATLEEFVYEKIWSETSEQDKKVLKAISLSSATKVETIRKMINMSSNAFAVYRNRLIRKGLVVSRQYGHLNFALPRFREFVLRNMGEEF